MDRNINENIIIYILTHFFIEFVSLLHIIFVCVTPGSYGAQAKRRNFCN